MGQDRVGPSSKIWASRNNNGLGRINGSGLARAVGVRAPPGPEGAGDPGRASDGAMHGIREPKRDRRRAREQNPRPVQKTPSILLRGSSARYPSEALGDVNAVSSLRCAVVRGAGSRVERWIQLFGTNCRLPRAGAWVALSSGALRPFRARSPESACWQLGPCWAALVRIILPGPRPSWLLGSEGPDFCSPFWVVGVFARAFLLMARYRRGLD